MTFNRYIIFGRAALGVAVLGLAGCSPAPAPPPERETRANWHEMTQAMTGQHVLVFSKTLGWRHKSIPAGQALFRRLSAAHGFSADFSEDDANFTLDNLAKYDAIVFLNTTGPVLSPKAQAAFKAYIQNGGGFVGIHAAADTHIKEEWPWFIDLVGGKFKSHPNEPSNIQRALLYKGGMPHPAITKFPPQFEWTDEWYDFERIYSRVMPLLTIDRQSYQNAASQGITPIAWSHEFDGGRSFYTNLGHDAANYETELFESHILGGLYYVVQSTGK